MGGFHYPHIVRGSTRKSSSQRSRRSILEQAVALRTRFGRSHLADLRFEGICIARISIRSTRDSEFPEYILLPGRDAQGAGTLRRSSRRTRDMACGLAVGRGSGDFKSSFGSAPMVNMHFRICAILTTSLSSPTSGLRRFSRGPCPPIHFANSVTVFSGAARNFCRWQSRNCGASRMRW